MKVTLLKPHTDNDREHPAGAEIDLKIDHPDVLRLLIAQGVIEAPAADKTRAAAEEKK